MNVIRNKKIAIVGGGPGGLTLARLLQKSGADVTVYERDFNKEVRVQGATLDLHEESGLAALNAAGLMDAFKANYRPGADKMRITDKNANILLDESINAKEELFRPEIDRGPLRNILLDSLQLGTVVWNSHLLSLSKTGNSWKLIFEQGETATADIVIAADGARSKIRPFITSIQPFFAGITIVEGTVYNAAVMAPGIYNLLDGGKIFAIGDEKTLIVSSKGDGSIVFYTGCKTGENWAIENALNFNDKTRATGWFLETFKGWDKVWLELFEHAAQPLILRPQYCMPLEQSWETIPNLTMLGDAAHLMPPYAGEGVNMAMLDALELSECLTDPSCKDLYAAIAGYEKKMLARFATIGAITMGQTASLHSRDALDNMLKMFDH